MRSTSVHSACVIALFGRRRLIAYCLIEGNEAATDGRGFRFTKVVLGFAESKYESDVRNYCERHWDEVLNAGKYDSIYVEYGVYVRAG